MGNAGHAEDLGYLIIVKNDDEINNPYSDNLTSHRMIKLWTNFIKYS